MPVLARFLIAVVVLSTGLSAEEIHVLSWNLESGGSDSEVIAEQIETFDGYELLGFSEVQPQDADLFATACTSGESANFSYLLGTTGGSDALMLVWNSDRFELLDSQEFLEMRAVTGRAPLAVKLKEGQTGTVFWFMVNHLHRTNANKRNEQAEKLRQWFHQQSLPVVAVGDYNLDYDVDDGQGNQAFNLLLQGGDVRWIEPAVKKRTQQSYNSILDFVFINDDAATWQISSTIIELIGEFSPAHEKSDHRPIDATIQLPTPVSPPHPVTPFGLKAIRPGTGPRPLAPMSASAAGASSSPVAGPAIGRRVRSETAPDDGYRSGTLPAGRSSTAKQELILTQIQLMRRQLDLLEQMLAE